MGNALNAKRAIPGRGFLRVPETRVPSGSGAGYSADVVYISALELFNGLKPWLDKLPLNPGRKHWLESRLPVALSLQELKLFQRALARAAEEGLLKRALAMRRIGEMEVLCWQAEDTEENSRQKRARISAGTKAGLERQRLAKKPGPHGRLGPGRPAANFDRDKARALKAKRTSYAKIAKACKVSKATIARFFKKEEASRNREQ